MTNRRLLFPATGLDLLQRCVLLDESDDTLNQVQIIRSTEEIGTMGHPRVEMQFFWLLRFLEQLHRVIDIEAGQSIAGRGLFALLRELTPEILVDQTAQMFWLERSHEHEVTLEAEEFVLTPSIFVWPHVRVNCDPPWPYGLIYPASSVIRAAHQQIPPGQLLRLLQALADDTRLRTLRCIAERPRSTQELASLVQVSEAAMSKHLRRLSDAGLLTSHREGYYVLYELLPNRLPALSPSLASFLLDAAAEEQ